MISLTTDQKSAVQYDDNLMLSACPGSGKTRVIIAKLLKLAEIAEGSPRSIACITYTNAAVGEIEARLKQAGSQSLVDRCEIATIHSFCLQFILRPYRWLLPEIPNKLKILTPEMREFQRIVGVVEDEQGRQIQRRTFDEYASIRMGIEGQPLGTGIDSGIVNDETARRYWELVQASGFIDFSMIVYFSLRILRENPFVAVGLSSRFAWLLVDEFQDTTDVQVEILNLLREQMNSRFFLVSDENQSIQSFTGARPDLANYFAAQIGARQDISLSGNFRSAPQIIGPAETLIPRNPAMYSAGTAAAYQGTVTYIHAPNPVEAITDHFLPMIEQQGIALGQAAVLAPWWIHLVPVARALREFNVPVFGPGARPYQRRRLYAPLAEQLGASVASETFSFLPGVERAVFRLISEAMGVSRFDLFSYDGRRVALSLIYEAARIGNDVPGGMDWLTTSARAVARLLQDGEWIDEQTAIAIINSVEEMRADMERRGVDIANLQIEDLGLFANPDNAVKLITLHNSKGREFDAVAIINANKGQIPHFTTRTQEQYDEARRLFYVGITRTRKHLMVFSDQTDRRNPPTPFIAEAGLEEVGG